MVVIGGLPREDRGHNARRIGQVVGGGPGRTGADELPRAFHGQPNVNAEAWGPVPDGAIQNNLGEVHRGSGPVLVGALVGVVPLARPG